jgi:hypothetical protein
MRVNRRVLWELRADVFEFCLLLIAGDRSMSPLPGGDALFQGDFVEIATTPEHCVQRSFLGRRGPQFLLVGLARRLLFHRNLFSLIGRETARARTAG